MSLDSDPPLFPSHPSVLATASPDTDLLFPMELTSPGHSPVFSCMDEEIPHISQEMAIAANSTASPFGTPALSLPTLCDTLSQQVQALETLAIELAPTKEMHYTQLREICRLMDPNVQDDTPISPFLYLLIKEGDKIMPILHTALSDLTVTLRSYLERFSRDQDTKQQKIWIDEINEQFLVAHLGLQENVGSTLGAIALNESDKTMLHFSGIPLLTEIQNTLISIQNDYTTQASPPLNHILIV